MNMNKINICKRCGYESDMGARCCQNCGNKLKPILSWRQKIALVNFNGLAGVGRKDINIFPLITNDLMGNDNHSSKTKTKVIFQEDGSWYCPDCGSKNKPYSLFCSQCGREN